MLYSIERMVELGMLQDVCEIMEELAHVPESMHGQFDVDGGGLMMWETRGGDLGARTMPVEDISSEANALQKAC
jgi:hypothetical protein